MRAFAKRAHAAGADHWLCNLGPSNPHRNHYRARACHTAHFPPPVLSPSRSFRCTLLYCYRSEPRSESSLYAGFCSESARRRRTPGGYHERSRLRPLGGQRRKSGIAVLPVRAQACICPPRLSVGHLRACRLQMCSLALTCHADGRPPCLRLLVQQLQHPIVWTHPALSRQDHAVPPSIRSSTITDSIAERREGRERCSRASLPPCLIPSNPVCLNLIPLPLCVKLCLALTCKCDWAGQHYAGRSGLGADICPRRLDLFKRSGTPPSLSSSLFVSPSNYDPLPIHTYLPTARQVLESQHMLFSARPRLLTVYATRMFA